MASGIDEKRARTRFITHSENGLITEEIGYRLEYGRWLLEDPKVSAGMFQTDDREKRVAIGKALLLSQIVFVAIQ